MSKNQKKVDWKHLRRELSGKTGQLYWCIETSGGISIEDIQMKKTFKKRSEVDLHLAKLRRLDLIERDGGGNYRVRWEVRNKINFLLKRFIVLGNYVVPRQLVGGILFVIFAVVYGFMLRSKLEEAMMTIQIGAVFAALFFMWSAYIWVKRPYK